MRRSVEAGLQPRRIGLLALVALMWLSSADGAYAQTTRTLRLDFYHTGTATTEVFSVDRLVIEPTTWPGNPQRPLDETNFGKYLFEVIDRASNRVLYSRGFASIFGEWETTGEAKEQSRTFQESLRFPMPAAPVQVVVKKRDAANAFAEVWSTLVDPVDQTIDPVAPSSPGPLIELMKNGDPATKVDLLILGDGYIEGERPKFEKDARRMVDLLFATSPFKERQQDFNVWGLCPPAAESGVSRPSTGRHRRSPVGTTYDAFGSERYVLTFENRAFRDLASFAPYDVVEIIVNDRTYGGGGIFNLYATVAVDNQWAPYVFVHEFGHHFAGLADEYYTSDVAYLPSEQRVEPWEANATALHDPTQLKWKDLVAPGTPLPTPWPKEAYEAQSRDFQQRRRAIRAANKPEAEMEALFAEQQTKDAALLSSGAHPHDVGAFEGALYEARGFYRPEADCIMFTRDKVPFCRVCQRAITRVIDLYTR
jgi:hypothetical protein